MPDAEFPDRERLLANGRLQVTVCTRGFVDAVTRGTWVQAQALAARLGLRLSEPIRDVSDPDGNGLQLVTLTAGVFDARDPADADR